MVIISLDVITCSSVVNNSPFKDGVTDCSGEVPSSLVVLNGFSFVITGLRISVGNNSVVGAVCSSVDSFKVADDICSLVGAVELFSVVVRSGEVPSSLVVLFSVVISGLRMSGGNISVVGAVCPSVDSFMVADDICSLVGVVELFSVLNGLSDVN